MSLGVFLHEVVHVLIVAGQENVFAAAVVGEQVLRVGSEVVNGEH